MRQAVPERRLQRTSRLVAFVCLCLLAVVCVQLLQRALVSCIRSVRS